jgi:ABC-2 type transport system permease protein
MNQVVGTADPKPPMGGMMGMGGQPQPKGDIRALWKALGIQVTGDTGGGGGEFGDVPAAIVWQDFNPYPKFQIRGIGPELVFIRNDAPGATNAFNPKEPVCARFEELLIPYPTGISQALGSKLSFTELIATSSTIAGTIKVSDWQANAFDPYLLRDKRGRPAKGKFTLAAWIRAEEPAGGADAKQGEKNADDKKVAASSAKPRGVNVIYVGDIDLLHSEFVQLRNQPNSEINFRFDNVPFVLNVIDAVAGDNRFLEIRTRKPRHSTLKTVEARAAEARKAEDTATQAAGAKYEDLKKKVEAGQKDAENKFADIQKKAQEDVAGGKEVDRAAVIGQLQAWATKVEAAKRQAEVELERIRRERDKDLARVERNRDQDIQKIQNEFKVWATVIPPIPPLLVGLVVWIRRRLREREGVSRTRMK